jgi:dihydroorotate dehydrogenase electron transfer subunit
VILIIGEGAGLGPAVAAADRLRASGRPPLVLLGSDDPFPFRPRPSAILVAGMPADCIACMPLLEDWGIASRLASPAGFPGCFEGTVAELAGVWLATLGPVELRDIQVLASASASSLTALAELCASRGLPFDQLSLANS